MWNYFKHNLNPTSTQVKLLFLKLRWLVVKCGRRLLRHCAISCHASIPFLFKLIQDRIVKKDDGDDEEGMNESIKKGEEKINKIKTKKDAHKFDSKKKIKNPDKKTPTKVSSPTKPSIPTNNNNNFSSLLWSMVVNNYHLLYEYASIHSLDAFEATFAKLLVRMMLSTE